MAVKKRFVIREDYTTTIIIITVLFFIWGLVSNLNGQLVPYMKRACLTTPIQNNIIDLSFFGAYFFMSIPAAIVFKRIGLKKGVMTGLFLCSLAGFLFYPAAEHKLFFLFFIAIVLLASGITFLQIAANPYITVLGKGESAAARLNLSQAFNSLGASLAPYISGFLLVDFTISNDDFRTYSAKLSPEQLSKFTDSQSDLVEPVYLAMGVLLFLIVVVFYFARFPKTEALNSIDSTGIIPSAKEKTLWLAVLAIFLYVGAEVTLAQYIGESNWGIIKSEEILYYYWFLMMLGRFIGAFVSLKIKPSTLLTFAALGNTLLIVLCFFLDTNSIAKVLLIIGFFNSIMFPTIFSLGISRLNTNIFGGTSVLIMAIVGGAVLPFIAQGLTLNGLFGMVAFCYAGIATFAYFCTKNAKRS